MKRTLFPFILACFLVFINACSAGEQKAKEEKQSSKMEPQTEVETFEQVIGVLQKFVFDREGKRIDFSERNGDTVMIDFWATWCKPCIEEINMILQGELQIPESIEFIAVSIDEDKDGWLSFINAKKPGWKQYRSPSKRLIDQLNVQYIPHKIRLNFSDSTMVLNYPSDLMREQWKKGI